MTWIKPSFGWMLYRSGYATKHRQESILKIKLTHQGFQEILFQAIPTSFDREHPKCVILFFCSASILLA
jgi:hypothetical protein